MNDLRYQGALDYIYSFVDYGSEPSDRYSAEVFELDRIRRMLAQLGNPHRAYPAIHIAGTKGKGSVAAMVASCLQNAGYRTGLYTSPHLRDFVERIQIDGAPIEPDRVADLVDELKPVADGEPEVTTYELMTAMAFLHFQRQEVDLAVLEVGLGGRLDSTNVVEPLVAVITSISLDHTHILGETLEEIAAEKGGIIKPNIPVVLAPQRPPAARRLKAIAAERGAPVVEVGVDWLGDRLEWNLAGQRIRFSQARQGRRSSSDGLDVWTPLLGPHQVENAVTAYAALQVAEQAGMKLNPEAYRQGFSQVRWPGRFQILSRSPHLVVDAAHNADSARRLQQTLQECFPDRPLTLVFGASEDKDIAGMLAVLVPVADRIVLTQAVHPRAADPYSLEAMVEGDQVEIRVPVKQAVDRALARTERDGVVVATGSLFVVGEVLNAWLGKGLEIDSARHIEGERA